MKSSGDSIRCSPEMKLLCACVRPSSAAIPAGDGIDWSRFLRLATNHHVIPLAHQSLKRAAQGGAPVPPEFLDSFRRRYMAIAAHNVRAVETARRLQRLMDTNGIQWMPVKGPALAVLAYGSPSLRQFEDLDFIVRRGDLLRSIGLLEAEGYRAREIPPSASRSRYLASLQDWSMQKPGEALHLDLKPVLISHVLSRPSSVDFLASACRPLPMGDGRELFSPGPEAMLLAVCVDGSNEMWFKLSSVADAAHLLAGFPDADWAGLLGVAAGMGHRRSLLVGALVAEDVLGCPLPEAFQKEARRDGLARRLAAEAAGCLRAGTSLQPGIIRQNRFAFRTRERWWDRWRFVSRLLFVPGPADLHQIALPDALYPLYSCLRPFRLAGDALRGRPRRIRASKTDGPES
mgnify:CR=1 FL=1